MTRGGKERIIVHLKISISFRTLEKTRKILQVLKINVGICSHDRHINTCEHPRFKMEVLSIRICIVFLFRAFSCAHFHPLGYSCGITEYMLLPKHPVLSANNIPTAHTFSQIKATLRVWYVLCVQQDVRTTTHSVKHHINNHADDNFCTKKLK